MKGKPMNRWLFPVWLTIFALVSASSPAQSSHTNSSLLDVAQAIQAAATVTTGSYPNADEVWVDEYMRAEYNPDGTGTVWDDEFVKVLTEKGKREQRSRSFWFALPYETIELTLVEIIKPDGTVVPVDVARQSRVMIDRSQMEANIYDPNHKILQLSLPGLDVGDMSHIVSRRTTLKARVPNSWSDYTIFESTSPLKHMVYEVLAPKGLPLRKLALRDEIQGTVTVQKQAQGDRDQHRWEVREVPRMYEEPNMPALHTVVQRLLLSTLPDWQSISKWYWDLSKPHLDATTPDLEAKVREIVGPSEARDEKIQRLFTFVSQQIRYMGITTETEAPGYEPHDVKITFQNRYGVCRDKAALLVAMLRLAGLPAYPVLIHVGPKKDVEVPQPYFNHAIVGVADGKGSYTLMDPTDESTTDLLPAYLCNRSYLVAHPDGETLRTSPIIPATNNLMRVTSTATLREDGSLQVNSLLRFEGINDNAYRGYFTTQKPEERRRFFEGAIKRRVTGARLTAIEFSPADMQDTSQLLTVQLQYEAPDFRIRGERDTLLPIPWLTPAIGYANFVLGRTGLKERKYTLETDIACGSVETFALDLGVSAGNPVCVPGAVTLNTNAISFTQLVEVRSNQLSAAYSFLLNGVEFTPPEYRALKHVLTDIEFERRKKPVFERDEAPDTSIDVRILSDSTRVNMTDEHTWTVSHQVRKEVLTYAGKKQHSELTFSYNPIWEDVELKSATVSSRTGQVHRIAPQEINLMDAGWVGSAPRYPAAKTLVVSLPGVEVGSVIEFEVVRHARGIPFFSLSASFRGFDPVDQQDLSIDLPADREMNVINVSEPGRFGYSVIKREGRQTHEWISRNQAPVPKEDALPPWWSFNPTVFVSTGDWKTYAEETGNALLKAAREADEARTLCRELIQKSEDAQARTRAIRDFVARGIRLAGPGLNDLPLSCLTPADRTLAEGYGNNADRAILLYALLKEARLKPEFVLVASDNPRLDSLNLPHRQCPQRGFFDTVLVRVPSAQGFIYLNDTDQYAELGTTPNHGRTALLLDGRITTVEASSHQRDHSDTLYSVEVETNGDAMVTCETKLFGSAFAAFHRRFAELPPEERRRHFLEMVAELSQAAEAQGDLVTEFDRYPGRQWFAVKIPRFAIRSGNRLYFTLPGETPQLAALRADRRTHPLYRSDLFTMTLNYRVVLPQGTTSLDVQPEPIAWTLPGGIGTVDFAVSPVREEGGRKVIEMDRRVELGEGIVSPNDYPALLDFNRRIRHPGMQTLMVEIER
jgi:transglutaminase-like putative cysteine protease